MRPLLIWTALAVVVGVLYSLMFAYVPIAIVGIGALGLGVYHVRQLYWRGYSRGIADAHNHATSVVPTREYDKYVAAGYADLKWERSFRAKRAWKTLTDKGYKLCVMGHVVDGVLQWHGDVTARGATVATVPYSPDLEKTKRAVYVASLYQSGVWRQTIQPSIFDKILFLR